LTSNKSHNMFVADSRFKKGLLTLLCLPVLTTYAQYNTLNEWYLGPSAGASLSSITLVPKLVDKLFTVGKTGGLTLRYISENHFGLQTELNVVQSGWEEDEQGLGQTASYKRRLNLLDMPFMLHAYTGNKAFRSFLNLGARFNYLLSENETIEPGTTHLIQHGKAVEKPFQYGVVGGGGVEVHLKRLVIGLDGRYTYYVSNLFSDAVGDDFNTSNLQLITLNAYVLFRVR